MTRATEKLHSISSEIEFLGKKIPFTALYKEVDGLLKFERAGSTYGTHTLGGLNLLSTTEILNAYMKLVETGDMDYVSWLAGEIVNFTEEFPKFKSKQAYITRYLHLASQHVWLLMFDLKYHSIPLVFEGRERPLSFVNSKIHQTVITPMLSDLFPDAPRESIGDIISPELYEFFSLNDLQKAKYLS